MNIIKCHLVDESCRLGLNNEHQVDRTYHVHTDVRTIATALIPGIFAATPDPVPAVLSGLSFNTYVNSVDIRATKEGNATFFIVSVQAGKLPDGQDPTNPTIDGVQDPLQAKTIVWCETMTIQELVTRDRDGKPLLNSADQEFDDAIIEDTEIPVIVWQKNYASYQTIMDLNREYQKTHNSKTFLGHPSETCKFLSLQAGPPQYTANNVKYFTGTGRIAVKADGWIKWIVNQGAEYYDRPKTQAGAKRINAVDAVGQLANGNVLLATDGTKLPAGQIGNGIGFYILKPKDYGPLIADN